MANFKHYGFISMLTELDPTDNKYHAIRIYREGIVRALTLYAWWKDGEQHVGSVSTTLKQAIIQVDEEFEEALEFVQRQSKGGDENAFCGEI